MLCYEFSNVFQKISTKDLSLRLLEWSFVLEDQSGNSRFWIYARAEDFTLERRTSRSSVHSEYMHFRSSVESHDRAWNAYAQKFMCFAVRSSERIHARVRVWFSRSSVSRAPIERENCASSTFSWVCSLLERENSQSSVESHARARPLFIANFEKCFKVHLSILIPS